MTPRVLLLVAAIAAFAMPRGVSAQESWPEGHGQRWERLVDGWLWGPEKGARRAALHGRGADDGIVELAPGQWWFAEAGSYTSFRVTVPEGQSPPGSALELYSVSRGSIDVGPTPEHLGAPPAQIGLLAEKLPWVERASELRAELGPGQDADWIAIRCTATKVDAYRFALDAYGFLRPAETWERLERAVRNADRGDWPVPSDPETLGGADVGRFLRAHRVLLPWPPAEDSGAERALRIQAWTTTDLLAREPVREHARTRDWDEEGPARYVDDLGRPWLRAVREREVTGPCTLRILARLAWPERSGDEGRHLVVNIRVGERNAELAGWPGADVEETSRLWNWNETPFGDRTGTRWLLSAPRETRVAVPPGNWRVRIEPEEEAYLLVQELRPIEPFDHRRPPGALDTGAGDDPRSAARASVARELAGQDRGALALLTEWTPPEALEEGDFPPVARDVSLAGWFLWRRLALALLLGDVDAADAVVPRLLRVVPGLRGDLAAEARLALLRYAQVTRRDGMARQVAQWIFDDPPAEPEDFVEALSAWCTGRRPLERMRAWPVTADPRVLRRFLADVEARSIREVFGTWADLGTVGATAGGRRWLIPIRGQVNDLPVRADAWSAWMNLRSQSGAGPWHVSTGEQLLASTIGRGYVQVVPAADWVAPLPLDVRGTEARLGRVGFRDAHALGLISFPSADRLQARPVGGAERTYLWRGQNVLFGAASAAEADPDPGRLRDLRVTGDTPEGWGLLTELFPLTAPAGSTPSIDFRGENYERAGLLRFRLGIARTASSALDDIDAPFSIAVGGAYLPQRRFLWISASQDPGPRESGLPPVESWSPGPIVTGFLLVNPGPALVRIECPGRWNAWASVAELDVAATPGGLLAERSAGSTRILPPSGLWEAPLGVTGDPGEAAAVAEATRRVYAAADSAARAEALEARGRLLWALGRNQAVEDLLAAELLLPEGSLDRDRISTALAVVSFRLGNDLELRARAEASIRGGGRSRELFLLAAAAALGTDDLSGARQWLHLARLEAEDGSVDLERFVSVALDEPPPQGEPADPLIAVMTDLLRLRRLDPATEVGPALLRLADRCDAEARLAAARRLFGRGGRFAAWALEARELAPYAGTTEWPPPRGLLAPLERARDLRNEEIVATPPRVRLAGRFGAWGAVWMTAGSELWLELPGPEVYELEWRSAHEVRDGAPHPDAAPARLQIVGLPSLQARTILASAPTTSAVCERLPWAWPGRADTWRVLAPAGSRDVRIRLQSGAGYLSVRRLVGPVWLAWDTRTTPAPAPPVTPPAPVSFGPDPAAPLVPDLLRRLNEARKAMQSPRFGSPRDTEALTALGDDLLYAVLTRAPDAEPEWIVRALDLYLRAHADGLGNAHWQASSDLARLLSRWTVIDLSEDYPEFRRIRINLDLPDDPAVAVSNALFYPTPEDVASVLFDSEDVVTWHHRAAEERPLRLEIVAETDPPTPGPVTVSIDRDGTTFGGGPLPQGERRTFGAGSAAEAMIAVRVSSANPLVRARARVTLQEETPDGWKAVVPERRTALHRAPAGRLAVTVRGPTLARLERWAPADLVATDDPAEWLAKPAEIANTSLVGVQRAGAGEAAFELEREAFVRLAVRTVDGAALARAVPPPVPTGDLAAEAVAPAAPDRTPAILEGDREQWRLVEYPGILEVYTLGALRHTGAVRDGDNADRDEIRGGVRLHWKPFEAPLYIRFGLEARKTATYPVLAGGQVRAQYGFSTAPDLSLRVIVEGWMENLHGYTGYSYESDARLRWRQVLDEQWILYAAVSLNHWWSSLGDHNAASIEPHPLIHSDYRDDHDRWLAADIRLRAIPWQNVHIDMRAGTRSNATLLPWDPDRFTYGVGLQAHHEDLFAELSLGRTLRVDDDHRQDRTASRGATLQVAWETWLGRGTWMSAEAGFSYDFDDHEREAWGALTFRFGGRDGTRHEHVDPELQRFERYQEARFPWQP